MGSLPTDKKFKLNTLTSIYYSLYFKMMYVLKFKIILVKHLKFQY